MYIPFENLPEESRIWIYQSNRKFSDDELTEIEKDLQSFLDEWESHGTPLEASFLTKYNRFLILAVNQDVQQATGCSIDKSVEFIQKLEQKYKVDWKALRTLCTVAVHLVHSISSLAGGLGRYLCILKVNLSGKGFRVWA